MLIPIVPTFVRSFGPAVEIPLNTNESKTRSSTTTVVQKFLPASLSKTGNLVKVVFFGDTSGVAPVTGCYIGRSATSGNAWNFAATPVQIFWGGSGSITVGQGEEVVSDVAEFDITGSQSISIAFQLASGSRLRSLSGLGSNFISYSKLSVTEAGTVSKGSSYVATSGLVRLISRILVA